MLVTLTTDFGYSDPFVGIMKGVIARINPDARVVDLSHGVPQQNVLVGALVLRHSVPYFPGGTVHVAVIDPGVGSPRRPLLIECDGSYFVGPDNGILSLALEEKRPTRIIHLSNPRYHLQPTSATFHGRDIFAPVAAYLSLGINPAAFGETVETFVCLTVPQAVTTDHGMEGEILYIDGFGNLFTNVRDRDLKGFPGEKLVISVGKVAVRGLAPNYASGAAGDLVAVINSWGLLEIAAYKDSAEKRTAAKIGDKVQVLLDIEKGRGHP
jgi:S-adenosylmethionine hydrolase